MDTFNTNLERANSICYGYTKYLDDYSKIFPFTTENIDGYIDYFDLVNKSLCPMVKKVLIYEQSYNLS